MALARIAREPVENEPPARRSIGVENPKWTMGIENPKDRSAGEIPGEPGECHSPLRDRSHIA